MRELTVGEVIIHLPELVVYEIIDFLPRNKLYLLHADVPNYGLSRPELVSNKIDLITAPDGYRIGVGMKKVTEDVLTFNFGSHKWIKSILLAGDYFGEVAVWAEKI